MQKNCEACGMPLTNEERFCPYCVNADGSVKTCEEIFEGGVKFFLSQFGGDRKIAEKLTRKNMSAQLYWQGKNCEVLKGEMATDDEFAEMMKKLG